MQWRDDREGKFMGGFMVSLQAHRLCRFYSLQTIFLSFPSSSEGGHQSAGFLYGSGRRIFGFKFLRVYIIDVSDIYLN